jgi:hypothetical protein
MSTITGVTPLGTPLDSKVWRFWLSSFAEFRVRFDDQQQVSDVEADNPDMRDKVLMQ